jgi:indoleamine 2,3-dioxygenase
LLINNIKSFVKARDFCQAIVDPYHCPSSFFIFLPAIIDMAQQHSTAVLQHVEDDPANMSRTLDPFTVTTSNGFMPLQTPETKLPKAFDPLIRLCERMPIVKEDGSPGLLASYQLGPTIDLSDALPDLTDEIDNLLVDGKPDLVAATAVFRDYAFLASAYLLEPCWEKWSKDSQQGYGLGRQRLPRNLAGPLTKTAKL